MAKRLDVTVARQHLDTLLCMIFDAEGLRNLPPAERNQSAEIRVRDTTVGWAEQLRLEIQQSKSPVIFWLLVEDKCEELVDNLRSGGPMPSFREWEDVAEVIEWDG